MKVCAATRRCRWTACACLIGVAWFCAPLPCRAQDLASPASEAGVPERRIVPGETMGQAWFEEYWPDGRLAAVRCAVEGRHELLREGHCRYKDYTGVLLTYHPDGTVAESIHLTGGTLDGLVEVYDALGHLEARTFFRQGVRLSADGLPTGERLGPGEAAPLPAPPVVPGPGGPVPGQPAGPTPVPPSYVPEANIPGTGPPGRVLPRPPYRPSIGFDLTVPLSWATNDLTSFTELGIGLNLLGHVHRRITLEVGTQYLHTIGGDGSYNRYDLPTRLGLRVFITGGAIAIYGVADLVATYARRDVANPDPGTPAQESAWYLGGEGGLGIMLLPGRFGLFFETRIGEHARVDGAPRLMAADMNGNLHEAMGNQFVLLSNIGISWNPRGLLP